MTDDLELYHEPPLPEGEEQAPPLTRTMGIVRWCILGGMALFALVMVMGYFGLAPWTAAGVAATQYHCPMHPTYVSNQPGDCPICGMSLVPIESSSTADSISTHDEHGAKGAISIAKPGQYYCPMDPEIASDTAGRCPVCGMYLEKFEPGMKFTCEMHPEVLLDHPGDCPICGMDLIVATDTTSAPGMHASEQSSSSVPGLVPVMLAPQRLQLIGLRTEVVQRRMLGSQSRLLGYVAPDETRTYTLSLRVSGWIENLTANQTGQQIEKGEPLLTIYSQELHQAVAEYQLLASDARADSEQSQLVTSARKRLLYLGLTESEIVGLRAKGTSDATVTLYSPLTGVVLSKSVNAGQSVTPSQELLTVADLGTVWVLADAYESQLDRLAVGQAVKVTTTAFPGAVFEGQVSFVYPTVDPSTRTTKVRIALRNDSQRLKPGMYVEVMLSGAGSELLSVSREAIMENNDMTYVFVMKQGNMFEPRQVKVGGAFGEYVELVSGLSAGESVVSSANFLIDSESRLQAAISGMGGSSQLEHQGHGK